MYNPYYYQPQYKPSGLKGYPVSSIEEVRAAAVDFDGSVFYFPDIANNRIFTKQINTDGTSSLNMYQLTKIPVDTANNNYITREEFEEVLKKLQAPLTISTVEKDVTKQF